MKILAPASLPAPTSNYSYGVAAVGLIYTAGIVGVNPSGEISETIDGQTKQTINNIRVILYEAGATLNDIISATVYLADFGDYRSFATTWATEFGDHHPARATVQSQLVHPALKIEIQVVAVEPRPS
jgi:2-iminobutanoate/2-iminopropanoate deaminase